MYFTMLSDGGVCFEKDGHFVKRMTELYRAQSAAEGESVAEIAVIVGTDCEAAASKTVSMSDMRRSLAELGAPHDLYSVAEADTCDLARYRLIVMLSADEILPARMAQLRDLQAAGVAVLWLHAPNCGKQGACSAEGISRTVGMNVVESAGCRGCFVYDGWMFNLGGKAPYFAIEDENAIPFAWFEDVSTAMAATKDYRSIYAAVPFIPSAVLREVAKRLGIFLYSEDPHVYVYANAGSIGVYNDTEHAVTVRVKWDGTYRDMLTDTCFTAESGQLRLPPRDLRAYLLCYEK